jgi:KDO2-lipid IV(A) lauroyltransferase
LKPKRIYHYLEYAALRILLFKLRLLPYALSRAFVLCLFRVIGYGFGVRKNLARRQLMKVYPGKPKAEIDLILRKLYRQMGLTVCETWLLREEKLIAGSRVTGDANVREAFALGRGAILATAHFGNWEGARILPRFGIPLSVVAKKQHNHFFDRFNNAIREQHGVSVIDVKRGLRDILAHLRKNEMVAILADQNAGKSGLILDFLGFPASHWLGVAKLSLRYKIPIVPGFALRTEQETLDLRFEPMIHHPELEDAEENYITVLNEINAVIERYIHAYPDQWFWVHKRWKATGVMDA